MTGKENQAYRRDVLHWLAWAAVIGATLIGLVDLARGIMSIALTEFAFAALALFLIPVFKKTKHLRLWSLALLLPFFSLILWVMSSPSDILGTDLMWIQTIPVFSYLVLGRKAGVWCSLFFVSLCIWFYAQRLEGMDTASLVGSVLNLLVCTTVIQVFAHIYERNREVEATRLLELASTDQLTGLANRLNFEHAFTKYLATAKRHELALSLALLDLDYFKQVNDRFGHSVGDRALVHAANLLQRHVRDSDLLARFGGEEFVVVMLGCSRQNCIEKINSLRENLVASPMQIADKDIALSFSAGVATLGADGSDLETLINNADRRLYQAKSQGRNCVVGIDPILT